MALGYPGEAIDEKPPHVVRQMKHYIRRLALAGSEKEYYEPILDGSELGDIDEKHPMYRRANKPDPSSSPPETGRSRWRWRYLLLLLVLFGVLHIAHRWYHAHEFASFAMKEWDFGWNAPNVSLVVAEYAPATESHGRTTSNASVSMERADALRVRFTGGDGRVVVSRAEQPALVVESTWNGTTPPDVVSNADHTGMWVTINATTAEHTFHLVVTDRIPSLVLMSAGALDIDIHPSAANVTFDTLQLYADKINVEPLAALALRMQSAENLEGTFNVTYGVNLQSSGNINATINVLPEDRRLSKRSGRERHQHPEAVPKAHPTEWNFAVPIILRSGGETSLRINKAPCGSTRLITTSQKGVSVVDPTFAGHFNADTRSGEITATASHMGETREKLTWRGRFIDGTVGRPNGTEHTTPGCPLSSTVVKALRGDIELVF